MPLLKMREDASVADIALNLQNNDVDAEIAAKKTFAELLSDPELSKLALQNDQVFHDVLYDADRRGYIHFSRLAKAMGLKDASTVSRWFAGKTAPDRFRRAFALRALEEIIRHDIVLLAKGGAPIGHLTIKQHPELGIEVLDLVS